MHDDIMSLTLRALSVRARVCRQETETKLMLCVSVLELRTGSHCSSRLFLSGQGGGHGVRYSGGFCQQQ